jgi:regulator of PEP synthase PpsR (kinase-PPPase family)
MSHTFYLVSGGTGASGEQLTRTVLAQFPEGNIYLVVVPHVRYEEQIDGVVRVAKNEGATLLHTMVDPGLRRYLGDLCNSEGVPAIDLMGDLLDRLEYLLGRPPLGQPGLYRQLHQDYFERVAAMEYTMAHDDGRDPAGWTKAGILLVGISRVGKTPLSLYLSVLGWKVANYPLVPGMELPPELGQVDPRRVFGLTIEPGQLVHLRQERQLRLGVAGYSAYTDPEQVYAEVEFGRRLYRGHSFTVIDVTDKPLESTADEVLRLVTARFDTKARRG